MPKMQITLGLQVFNAEDDWINYDAEKKSDLPNVFRWKRVAVATRFEFSRERGIPYLQN